MKTIIETIFGVYSPVTYIDENGISIVASGLAGVDWIFITGVLLFAIVLYSFFRLLGVFFK